MTHTVVVLEDQVRAAEATRRLIRLWDPAANVVAVRTVADAKRELVEHDDVAYAIIDLLLEPSPSDQQGKALVYWILDQPRLSDLPILILSAFPEMINEVRTLDRRRIKIARKTSNLEDVYAQFKPLVDEARRRFERDFAGGHGE